MNAQPCMKPVFDICTPATRAAVEAYNAAITGSIAARAAVETERAEILADALGGVADAATIRRRCDAARERLLDADLSELRAMRDFPRLNESLKADFQSEAERLDKLATAREAEVSKRLAKAGMDAAQVAAALEVDQELNRLKGAREDALSPVRVGFANFEDANRIAALEAEICGTVSHAPFLGR